MPSCWTRRDGVPAKRTSRGAAAIARRGEERRPSTELAADAEPCQLTAAACAFCSRDLTGAGRKHLTESEWNAVPSRAKIRRRVDLSNSGRRPRVDSRQKRYQCWWPDYWFAPFGCALTSILTCGSRWSVFCESGDDDRHDADCRKKTCGALHVLSRLVVRTCPTASTTTSGRTYDGLRLP